MGYRLCIMDKKTGVGFYGTKHYGYNGTTSEELMKFPSFQYLDSLGKIEFDTLFQDGFDNRMTLTSEQFNRFITLYSKELGVDGLLEHEEIPEIMASDGDKEVSWG